MPAYCQSTQMGLGTLPFSHGRGGVARVTGPHLRLQLLLQFCPNYRAWGGEKSREDLEYITKGKKQRQGLCLRGYGEAVFCPGGRLSSVCAVGSPTVLLGIPHPCAVSKPPNSLAPQGELSKLLLWFSLERRVGGGCAFLAEDISQHVAMVK